MIKNYIFDEEVYAVDGNDVGYGYSSGAYADCGYGDGFEEQYGFSYGFNNGKWAGWVF